MSLRFRNFFKNLFFILTINLIILFTLEGLSRIFIPSARSYFVESKDEQGRIWAQYRKGPLKPKFLKNKDPNTFRIFTFGGSSTLGFPYYPRSSFSRMLEYALQKSVPEKKIELANLGLNGMNSLEIRRALFESIRYSPDLIIIYSGHNEFFQGSLIPDWRYPTLERFLEFIRSHSRFYQVLTRADILVGLIPSVLGTRQELIEKIGMDLEEMPMESRPMSQRFYHDRIRSYEYHINQILSRLDKEKIPTIICTVAVNLKDWPPEWLPYPENLTAEQWTELKQTLLQAQNAIADGKLDEAEKLLNQAKPFANKYAMYYFLLGQLEAKKGDQELAKEHFLSARELDNSRHRAPPEINRLIRKLAKNHKVVLADIENMFFENSQGIPGFDLFVDHVHPNLYGQSLIAQKLLATIKENNFIRITQPSQIFPDMEEFRQVFQLDDRFLSEINLKISTYYLLQRHLPDRDEHTIQTLEDVISQNPDELYARLCLSALWLEQSCEEKAIRVLEESLKRARGTQEFQKMLERYFFPKIVMQGNYLLFHLNLDQSLPPLRGILLVRRAPEQTRTRTAMSLRDYQWIFEYSPDRNELTDFTTSARELINARDHLCRGNKFETLNVNNYFSRNPEAFFANDSRLSAQDEEIVMEMKGADPWLVIPVKISTLNTSSIQLELSLKPELKNQTQAEFNLYWSNSTRPIFSEDKKISLPLKADGRFHVLNNNLSDNINWLSSQEIFYLRIDPANFTGIARIRNFRINLCSNRASESNPQ